MQNHSSCMSSFLSCHGQINIFYTFPLFAGSAILSTSAMSVIKKQPSVARNLSLGSHASTICSSFVVFCFPLGSDSTPSSFNIPSKRCFMTLLITSVLSTSNYSGQIYHVLLIIIIAKLSSYTWNQLSLILNHRIQKHFYNTSFFFGLNIILPCRSCCRYVWITQAFIITLALASQFGKFFFLQFLVCAQAPKCDVARPLIQNYLQQLYIHYKIILFVCVWLYIGVILPQVVILFCCPYANEIW